MRILIDGYNLMHAQGVLARRLGPNGLRRARQRFLNDLADALGAVDAHQTTVVFDAAEAPDGVPSKQSHKGLTVVFAVDHDDADARIERLIAEHSHPKNLTVVSSDRRIRQAASRRRARGVASDAFLVELEARRAPDRARLPVDHAPARQPDPDETAFWLAEFAHLDQDPATREALSPDDPMLTDDEIARLERELDREFE